MNLQTRQQQVKRRGFANHAVKRLSLIAAQACVWFWASSSPYAGESARKPGSSSAVAVLDFSVTGTGEKQLAWAGSGIADLLQIELNQAGVVTLDRDFIQAVLREQRLLAESWTAQDRFKLGALLHARYLVTGKVAPLEAGRFRVEATVFSVEAIETLVTAVDEGAYPKEMSKVVASVSRKLTEKLRPTPGGATQSQAPVRIANPESLIMFYRGLNACARGRPEVAVAWFMNSAELDHTFAAPLLWEIKAYEMAGFAEHAAIRREEVSPILKKLGVESGPHDGARDREPVFAVLDIVVSGGNSQEDATLSASVALALQKAFLATKQARLFAYQNIGEALAEQDLKLSSLFASQGAPRYGRWLMSDALLLGRVERLDAGRVAFDLSLVDPLTGVAFVHFQRNGTLGELDSIIATASRTLVNDWSKHKPATTSNSAAENVASRSIEEEVAGLRPAFRDLALALTAARRSPTDGQSRVALADGFIRTGRPCQGGKEINHRLDLLDVRAPKADLIFFGTHRWIAIDIDGARSYVDEQKLARLVEGLLTNYPDSLAAGCMNYNLARDAWRSGNWETAVEQSRRSRKTLEMLTKKGVRKENHANLMFIVATCFLEGASLSKLDRLDEAEAVLKQGQDVLKQSGIRPVGLPSHPSIHEWLGFVEVDSFSGGRPDLATRIAEHLTLISQARAGQTPVDYERQASEIMAAENFPRKKRGQDWQGCAQRILEILERVPPENEKQFNAVLAITRQSFHMVSYCAQQDPRHDAILQPLAGRAASTVFKKFGISSLTNATSLPQPRLLALVGEVNGVCCDAGLANEAATLFAPFFDEPNPPEVGFSVLLQLNASTERWSQVVSQLAARLPGGERDVPAACWLRLAQQHSVAGRYRDALVYYRKAVAKDTKPENCPGLSTTLVEAALERDATHSTNELRRICAGFQTPVPDPFWFEWFNVGRKHQTALDYPKAIACYQNAMAFLEHPEESGVFRLENQPGSDRVALRWGASLGEVDLLWSNLYASRWASATFYLAECLIRAGRADEAAPLLRRMALTIGGDNVDLLEEATWFSSRSTTEAVGVRATEMLKNLHEQNAKANDLPANATQSQPPVRSP